MHLPRIPERALAAPSRLPKPNQHRLRLAENPPHQPNLVRLLLDITLINTQRVHPQDPLSAPLAELLQREEQIMPNGDGDGVCLGPRAADLDMEGV